LAVTVFSDDFEGVFPDGWTVGNDSGVTTSKWGDNQAKAAGGSWSAFCGDNGSNTRDKYVNNLHTYMERRNVSLDGYVGATLSFKYWLNSQADHDYFKVRVKDQSGTWHEVYSDSGNDSALGWQSPSIDLSAYAGQTGLTIQYRFDADAGTVSTAPSGVWVDDVLMTAEAPPAPDLVGSWFLIPDSAHWGETLGAEGRVYNQGQVGAGAFTQSFYLSADATWGDADDVFLGSYSHGALDAGAYGPYFDVALALPASPPGGEYASTGVYRIGMKTDSGGAVAEGDETNNGPGAFDQWADWDRVSLSPMPLSTAPIELTLFRISDTSGTRDTGSPGIWKDTFFPGETVRITLKAVNGYSPRAVQTTLLIYGPDNTTLVYDSHDPTKTGTGQKEDNSADSPLNQYETDYYSFDWTLPAGAAAGAYDLVGSIRLGTVWGTILDTTAPGAGTTSLGLDARLRDVFWRFYNTPENRTYEDTSEYLAGQICVNLVLPSSTGAASTEDWTSAEITNIEREITAGVSWWAVTMPDAHLSFVFDWTYADNPVSTTYEPITRPQSDEDLWINQVMDAIYPQSSGDYTTRVRQYDDYTRRATGSDWAFTVFVADDTVDTDNKFSDGYFAYAYVGGPFAVMTYDNDGWGIDSMEQVVAHETGHMFYALDEYAGSDWYTAHSGYYNTQNLNAYDGNLNPSSRVNSIMAETSLQDAAYAAHTSSSTSLQMTGYKDTDSDHILDVLDTTPAIATTVQASDFLAGSIRIQATGTIVPLDNLNPKGSKHDLSLNVISAIQYRIDDGAWQTLSPADGYYDEYQETAVVDLAGLTGGNHHIYFRTQSSVGRWSSNGNYSLVADVAFYVNDKPVIGGLTDAPDPVVRPNAETLTATGVSDSTGWVVNVAFYRETNGVPGLQIGAGGDLWLGTDSDSAGGWTWTFVTGSLAAGTYTYYAQATDNDGTTSADGTSAASTTNTVQDPATATWVGTASDHWEVAANWSGGTVPGAGTVVIFDGAAPNQPRLYGLQAVKGLDFRTAGWVLSVGGFTLSVGASGITMAGGATSQIDVGTGVLIVDYTAGGGSPMTAIRDLVQAGFTSGPTGYWDGNGIASSAAATNSTGLTALGMLDTASTGAMIVGGTVVDDSAVVVKYTWYGDNDLNGTVDWENDFLAFQNGILFGVGGSQNWLYGDYNYNGSVDWENDFLMFQNGVLFQSGPLAGGDVAASSATSAASAAQAGAPGLFLAAGRWTAEEIDAAVGPTREARRSPLDVLAEAPAASEIPAVRPRAASAAGWGAPATVLAVTGMDVRS
jgi:hypothetical protein